MTIRCDCCDLPVEYCGKEAERRLRRASAGERERLLTSGWIAAEYEGPCARCKERVIVGDPIQRRVEGWIGGCCS